MRGVVPAIVTKVFRNERLVRSRRVMAKSVCTVNGTRVISGLSAILASGDSKHNFALGTLADEIERSVRR